MSQPRSLIRLVLLALLGGGSIACSDSNNGVPAPGPAPTELGNVFVVTSASRVLSFQLTTPRVNRTAVAITGLANGETILDADTRPARVDDVNSQLYVLGSTGRLYVLDPATGMATAVAGMPIALDATATAFGIDFNPLPDRLRIVSDTGQNLRVHPDTSAVMVDTPLTMGGAAQLDVSDVAYTNSFADGCTTRLFYIDTETDMLLSTAVPNDGVLTPVGALGVDATTVTGFDLVGSSANALAILTVDGTAGVYFVDTATGVASLREALAGLNQGETPVGLAGQINADVLPAGNMAAVTASNRLVTFNRADPTRTCTTVDLFAVDDAGDPIAAPDIVGLDVRQADGQLYGLGADGSVLMIDAPSGEIAVVLPGLLVGDGATPPVATPLALDGAVFGIDFNPVVDRLRIVSDTGQNLRVNLDAGADAVNTTVDTVLSQQNVSAVGYTNSDPVADAPTATTLFYVNAATDRLFSSAAPNTGALTLVGPLGVNVSAQNGFDIEGSGNRAFLASSAAGTSESSLYSIDLATGIATLLVNPMGGSTIGAGSAAGAERVRALTVFSP